MGHKPDNTILIARDQYPLFIVYIEPLPCLFPSHVILFEGVVETGMYADRDGIINEIIMCAMKISSCTSCLLADLRQLESPDAAIRPRRGKAESLITS